LTLITPEPFNTKLALTAHTAHQFKARMLVVNPLPGSSIYYRTTPVKTEDWTVLPNEALAVARAAAPHRYAVLYM